MGDTLRLTADDGHEFGGYKAAPSGPSKGAIVLIQEIFGVNGHIRKVCDGFAQEGFVTLAPALFDRVERDVELGYDEAGVARGREIMGEIGIDGPVKDIAAAQAALDGDAPVFAVGYCWGGRLAWLAATRLAIPSVGYYGGGIAGLTDETPQAPIMLHFGEKDHAIPMSDVEAIGKAHPYVPIHVYDAGHGFNCDERGSHDKPSADQARRRTLAFLDALV